MQFKAKSSSKGFTLVELSIVIIIIGFLIAGISAGTSLIQQSKLSAVINEVTSYKSAFYSFYNTYNYTPGDLPHAYALWGSLSGTTCTNADVNVDYQGCNGNGNGNLDAWYSEGILAWEQLGLSGFIPGHYTTFSYQTSGPAGTAVIGTNVPGSIYPNAAYHLLADNIANSSLEIGGARTNDRPATNIMTSADAKSVDQKMDDGNPNTGLVQAGNTVYGYSPEGGGWADYCSDGGSNYLLSTPGIICRLCWKNFFIASNY